MVSINILTLLILGVGVSCVQALFPIPRSYTSGNATLALSKSFYISIKFDNAPLDLCEAVDRTQNWIYHDEMLLLSSSFGADVLAASPPSTGGREGELHELQLFLANSSSWPSSIYNESIKAIEDRDESYHLSVPSNSSTATLTASTTLGLLRGLTTFEQLWYTSPTEKDLRYAPYLPIEITDEPWFPWRGFGLDTARNFFPLKDLRRTLDAMLMTKLNVFYWHIVDSQSFPLSLPSDPSLAVLSTNGAYSPAMIYSPEDVKGIVEYAGKRGIDVVLEIDTPGHTDIVALSYPEWVACHTESPWASFANEPPAGQLRFVLPEVSTFVSSLFTATAALLPSKYFSTGGDELNIPCFENDTVTQNYLNTTNSTLEQGLDNFTIATHSTLKGLGKTPVVWEEMVLAHNVTLLNETMVIVWISSEDAKLVSEKGFSIIHAPSNYFYLDCGQGGWLGDFQGASWCSFVSWQNIYAFDPYLNITSTNEHLVKGGQTMLWTEQSSPESLDATIWPRAAAAAELWWKGGPAGSYPLETASVLPRLHDLRYRMVDRGIGARALQPLWCTLRPGACDLTA